MVSSQSSPDQTPPVITAVRRPRIYLESRYRKLVRDLPQTIFYCTECKGDRQRRKDCARCAGFGKLTRDSVQELIARPVLPAFKAKAGKFHGAGREDIDVRMLGRGRPFVFEIIGARRTDVDLEELRQRIHATAAARIDIDPFRPVSRRRVVLWKESRLDKIYRAEVELGAAVPPECWQGLLGRAVALRQRTPQRVAHRRADLERQREVRVLAIQPLGDDAVGLDLRCVHGTYVKEWISGDDGRTTPSLPDLLGAPARCRSLDVLDILDAEAPPPTA